MNPADKKDISRRASTATEADNLFFFKKAAFQNSMRTARGFEIILEEHDLFPANFAGQRRE